MFLVYLKKEDSKMPTREIQNQITSNGNKCVWEHTDRIKKSNSDQFSESQRDEMRIQLEESMGVFYRQGKLHAKEEAIISVAEGVRAGWTATVNKTMHIVLKIVVFAFYTFFFIERGDSYMMAVTTAVLLVIGASMLVEHVWSIYAFEKLRKGDRANNMATTKGVAIVTTVVSILVEFAFIGLAVYEFVVNRMFSEAGLLEKIIAIVSGFASGIPLIIMSALYGLSNGTNKTCSEKVIAEAQKRENELAMLRKLSFAILMLTLFTLPSDLAMAKSPNEVYFLIDGSGSMRKDDRKTQIAGALSKTCMAINGNSSIRFFLFQIGQEATLLFEGQVTRQNMQEIAKIVRSLDYKEQLTNIIDGIQQVGVMADPNSEIVIIFGSDGLHTSGNGSQSDAYEALLKLDQKLKQKAITLSHLSVLGADESVRLSWREASRKAFGTETKMTISGFSDLQTGVDEVIDQLK